MPDTPFNRLLKAVCAAQVVGVHISSHRICAAVGWSTAVIGKGHTKATPVVSGVQNDPRSTPLAAKVF